MKSANTNMYLMQNNPSLMTIATLLRQTIMSIMMKNKDRMLNEILKTADEPMHSYGLNPYEIVILSIA